MTLNNDPSLTPFELVGDLDVAGAWEFDTLAVLRDDLGRFFTAHDSGCSCPSPFEDTTAADLTGPLTFHEAAQAVQEHAGSLAEWNDYRKSDVGAAAVELIARMRGLA